MTTTAYIKHPAMPEGMSMQIDPANLFNGVPYLKLIEACGFIPGWLIDAYQDPANADMDMQEVVDRSYGFGLYPFDDMEITDDEELVSLRYPEDPPYRPYLKVRVGNQYMYQFDHAMLAFVTPDGELFVTRCD